MTNVHSTTEKNIRDDLVGGKSKEGESEKEANDDGVSSSIENDSSENDIARTNEKETGDYGVSSVIENDDSVNDIAQTNTTIDPSQSPPWTANNLLPQYNYTLMPLMMNARGALQLLPYVPQAVTVPVGPQTLNFQQNFLMIRMHHQLFLANPNGVEISFLPYFAPLIIPPAQFLAPQIQTQAPQNTSFKRTLYTNSNQPINFINNNANARSGTKTETETLTKTTGLNHSDHNHHGTNVTMTVNPYTNLPLQHPPPQQQKVQEPSPSAVTQPQPAQYHGQPQVQQQLQATVPSPGLTIQDHPTHSPVYNGVNLSYPNLQILHQNPPIFAVPHFLTPTECDFLICISQDCLTTAPVVGKGAGEVTPSRTSSTCYLAREDLPDYLHKISLLTGKPVSHCELPQVGRYLPSQQYLQHFDAFDLSNEDGRRFAANGGQRTVTVLTYLNDVNEGGHTAFPTLNLEIKPQKGMAIVFFPATVDGLLDKNALHAAKPAVDTKYVSQVWIRQGDYDGVPSKRMFSSVEQASIVQKSLICAREGNVHHNPAAVEMIHFSDR